MYPELTMKNSRQSHHPRQKREQKKKMQPAQKLENPIYRAVCFCIFIYLRRKSITLHLLSLVTSRKSNRIGNITKVIQSYPIQAAKQGCI